MATLSAISRDELPARGTRDTQNSKSAKLVSAFVDSDLDLVEVEITDDDTSPKTGEKLSPQSVRGTLAAFAERHRLGVRVFTQGNRVFMEKGDPDVIWAEENRRRRTRSNGNDTAPAEAVA